MVVPDSRSMLCTEPYERPVSATNRPVSASDGHDSVPDGHDSDEIRQEKKNEIEEKYEVLGIENTNWR